MTEMSKPLIYTGAPGDPQLYQVRQGGLMRCCLRTLADYHTDVEPPVYEYGQGTVMACDYCSTPMVFTDGAWEWDKARQR